MLKLLRSKWLWHLSICACMVHTIYELRASVRSVKRTVACKIQVATIQRVHRVVKRLLFYKYFN